MMWKALICSCWSIHWFFFVCSRPNPSHARQAYWEAERERESTDTKLCWIIAGKEKCKHDTWMNLRTQVFPFPVFWFLPHFLASFVLRLLCINKYRHKRTFTYACIYFFTNSTGSRHLFAYFVPLLSNFANSKRIASS